MRKESTHSVKPGRSIIERLEIQMDKRRKQMEKILIEIGAGKEHTLNKGRYEGLALAISIMRNSSIPHEIERSNERLGIE
jgi:hypothetical protein